MNSEAILAKKGILHSDHFSDKYDFCMVLPTNPQGSVTEDGRRYLEILELNGLDTFLFKGGKTKLKIFVLIQASKQKLRTFAKKVKFIMELDEEKLQLVCENGNKEFNIKPFKIADRPDIVHYRPYEQIWMNYSDKIDESIYWREEGEEHPFGQNTARLKLIAMMIQTPVKGAQFDNINIRKSLKYRTIRGLYPLHRHSKLNNLKQKWLKIYFAPWQAPCDEVKDYFGEKIGLYFLFIGHYTKWLCAPAFFALFMQILSTFDFTLDMQPYFHVAFSFFVSLWAIFLLEFWKR